ncbi:MAG: hypothetical protein PHG35_05105 [Dehalococcoidales bacterium]|nr:hypothetical protein [Dehalococcoidales bacterium]
MNSIFSWCKRFTRNINKYRLITGIGFIAAMALALTAPLPMPECDDWAYYYGVQNFAEGDLTIDSPTLYYEAYKTQQQGNVLIQYLPVGEDEWALEKAPGSVFYLVPFYKMGIPRWGNVLLALGMVIVTYVLLKRWRDEKAAMIGSLLVLFTPIAMVMCNRIYMDSYAALAFMVMGAGLYFYYHLERNVIKTVRGGVILFLAFLFIGWSVVCRYTNLPIAVILFLHYAAIRFVDWRRGKNTGIPKEILPIILGIGIPMAGLFLYDYFIFGSPLSTGYSISPFPIKYAFQYWGQTDSAGALIPLEMLRFNIEGAARNLLLGLPLLFVGVPGFFLILYFKLFKRRQPEGKWSSLDKEMPWDILIVLICWFLAVLVMNLTYEWLAGMREGGGFVLVNRFYLPWLLPVVIICALVMARFPHKALIPVLGILVVYGALSYAQWIWELHILPEWMTNSNYVWPPWMFELYYHGP